MKKRKNISNVFFSKQRLRKSTLLNKLSKENELDKLMFQLNKIRGI